MKKHNSLLAMALGALLSGCASDSQVNIDIPPPTNSEVCCSDFSQFPYSELNTKENLNFEIDSSYPVGKFSDGNSYFSAFRFNDRSGQVEVTVEGEMVDDSVFAPEIILLDEEFNFVEKLPLEGFQILPSSAFNRTRYIERFKADVDKTPYMVIYTPADELGKQVQVDHPAKARAKEFGEVMPMVTDPIYTHQLTGKVSLTVDTLKLRAFRVNQPVKPVEKTVTQAVEKSEVVVESSQKTITSVQPETKSFYISSIEKAVASGDIPKALSLLDEAKALNIDGAQEAFVKAVNKK